ncbi:MAG TPA: NAD(P)-dependent oxidoreductase [Bacteroidota bacterium]|nr:NAD(P)-dependent oxidoreductase [Bacteroidota bacterium]
MKPTVGFIGLGLMGLPMAQRLQSAGFPLNVYNRTRQKAEGLLSQGAVWCDSPAKVARQSEIVFTMISTSEVLKELAAEIRPALNKGSIHIDTSTVSPSLTAELYQEYRADGKHFLHSPVLGSIPQATDGTLLLFVGGDDDAYRRSEDALKVLGKQVWRFPEVDQASHTKLLCNLFIAGMITTLAQAIVFAQKAGVDPRTLLDILPHSALNSPMYQSKGKSIIEGNFTPRFFLDHMLKDINLMLEAAGKRGVSLPTIEVAQELFAQASQMGLGKEDYSAVVKVLSSSR